MATTRKKKTATVARKRIVPVAQQERIELRQLTKQQMIQALTTSPHGNLHAYVPVYGKAARDDAEFYAHLVSWNRIKGSVRDAQTAMPVIALTNATLDSELEENALAHMASLSPRDLVSAWRFSRFFNLKPGSSRRIREVVESYLRDREEIPGVFDRAVAAHRDSMKALYALNHIKPGPHAQKVLFDKDYTTSPLLRTIRELPKMPVLEAAGAILEMKIPFLTARGALGKRMSEPDLLMALIERMSPTELITSLAQLEKLGVMGTPVLRAAFENALTRAKSSGKNVLKTSKATASVKDEKIKEKLATVQEDQIKRTVDGNWLVLADKSGSMEGAIEAGRQVASILSRSVSGKVHLVFFDTMPALYDVTGRSHEEIQKITRLVTAHGGTSIGCGLQLMLDRGIEVDGIAVVSDGGENQYPFFNSVYDTYCSKFAKTPTVYFYKLNGEPDRLTGCGVNMQVFDLRGGFDYYSLPNLVQTMRHQAYSLVTEVMETPLLKLSEVYRNRKEAA